LIVSVFIKHDVFVTYISNFSAPDADVMCAKTLFKQFLLLRSTCLSPFVRARTDLNRIEKIDQNK